jgi:hypothetical protein
MQDGAFMDQNEASWAKFGFGHLYKGPTLVVHNNVQQPQRPMRLFKFQELAIVLGFIK